MSITNLERPPAREIDPGMFLDLELEIEQLVRQLLPSVVSVRNGSGDGGAGVVWSNDLLVTNRHVASGERCRVTTRSGEILPAVVVARHDRHDLALLRLDSPPHAALRPIPIAATDRLRIGQLVLAIGHPMGVEWASTVGTLSRMPGNSSGPPVLRASITLLPGNSGGPLVDANGALIGINAMVSGPAEAIAVPLDIVREFVSKVPN